jgi:hypothetical protein
MFNLIVSGVGWQDGRDTFPTARVFEHTDDALVARFAPNRQLDLNQLMALPTLFAQEGRDAEIARVGTITRLRQVGRDLMLEFAYDMQVAPIQNRSLIEMAQDLEIADFEFWRTHWPIGAR